MSTPDPSTIQDGLEGSPPGFETDARRIAENVLAAITRVRDDDPFGPDGHVSALAVLMRALLAVMPVTADHALSEACNRALAHLPVRGRPLPWVEAVALSDGSVILRVS